MSECMGVWGRVFGHKYEPRYDSKLPTGVGSVEGRGVALFEAMKDRTYRGDVCRRCGDVVNEPADVNT